MERNPLGPLLATVSTGLPADPLVAGIVIHLNDPEVIYTGTQDGLYRSANRGNSWERLTYPKTGASPWIFMFRPGDPSLMYLGSALGEIYRSTNGGAPS